MIVVSRGDAIAIVNRGGDYVTHVVRSSNPNWTFMICGKALKGVLNEHECEGPSCKGCQRAMLKAREAK